MDMYLASLIEIEETLDANEFFFTFYFFNLLNYLNTLRKFDKVKN